MSPAITQDQLVAALNEDLAYELSAIIQYLTYAAKVSGPSRPELRAFFEAEIPDETMHAQFLAGKIVALGGEPTTAPKPVPQATSAKEMLQAILKSETEAHDRYAKRSAQAESLGMKGLQVQLEDMARDESEHRDETARILRRWEDT
ncbi:MAG TPA: ferritin-like domain-containing protein [Phycisphaerales bacterium]|nr:ferritin-like domain-containing protein [Phycisphaerales bacterium]